MRKVYVMPGVVEYMMRLVGKKGVISCHFTGGALNGHASLPATFVTCEKGVQEALEASDKFKSGRIKLKAAYSLEVPEVAKSITIESVKNLQEARQYLMEQGFQLKDVASKANVLEAAESINVVFPNWNR